MSLGFDSLSTVQFVSELAQSFQVSLVPTLLFDFPTVSGLARAIARGEAVRGPLDVPTEAGAGRKWVITSSIQHLVADIEHAPPPTQLRPEDVYEPLSASCKHPRYRRATDGMECILIPAGIAWVGDGLGKRDALPNERPCHRVCLQSFLIDVEPVCAGAFARFLNCVQPDQDQLTNWMDLRPSDPRVRHLPLHRGEDGTWRPKEGVPERWPMIMVSWYGANAYSLWANCRDWRRYREASESCLPTEAQWEYAARGPRPSNFPWGDTPASEDLLVFCPKEKKLDPETKLEDFPLAPVNAELGTSPFGLRGMAGNVWQWCRDTYDPTFYATAAATLPDAWNSAAQGPKSERGGSWVGPASVARCSYRRGRAAGAKGRCLGFRCVGDSTMLLRAASADDSVSTEACSASGDTTSNSSEPGP